MENSTPCITAQIRISAIRITVVLNNVHRRPGSEKRERERRERVKQNKERERGREQENENSCNRDITREKKARASHSFSHYKVISRKSEARDRRSLLARRERICSLPPLLGQEEREREGEEEGEKRNALL